MARIAIEEVHIAICDDEERWRKDIIELCDKYAKENEFVFVYKEYECGEDLLEDKSFDYDVLLLDVEMQGMSGLDVRDKLHEARKEVQIMFVTSHNENVYYAFWRNVYGFVPKPLDEELFFFKFNMMIEYIVEERKTIILHNYGKIKVLYLRDVMYIEADGKYSKIYVVNSEECFFSDKNIGFWKEYLEINGFEMSERSILINLAEVSEVGQNEVVMKNCNSLSLSRRMRKDFAKSFKEYAWKRAH